MSRSATRGDRIAKEGGRDSEENYYNGSFGFNELLLLFYKSMSGVNPLPNESDEYQTIMYSATMAHVSIKIIWH